MNNILEQMAQHEKNQAALIGGFEKEIQAKISELRLLVSARQKLEPSYISPITFTDIKVKSSAPYGEKRKNDMAVVMSILGTIHSDRKFSKDIIAACASKGLTVGMVNNALHELRKGTVVNGYKLKPINDVADKWASYIKEVAA